MVLRNVMKEEWGYGFNALTLEYEDLFAAGVCDPATVTTWSLENSASIAGSLLQRKPSCARRSVPSMNRRTTGLSSQRESRTKPLIWLGEQRSRTAQKVVALLLREKRRSSISHKHAVGISIHK